MSEIALLTDTHFGIYKSSDIFLESQLKFFRECFIPYLKENNITRIIHCGDLFDNRNNINIKVFEEVRKLFQKDLKDFEIYLICGNHDSYFKTSIQINSINWLNALPNVTVFKDIEKIKIEKREFLFVPWQVNEKDFVKRVSDKNIYCDVCIGHFETVGFSLNKTVVCQNGLPPELFFNNYGITFSGHFHKKQVKKYKESFIQYIGNPYHLNRNDIGEERGFCILNIENLDYKFVNNDKSIKFIKIEYPEKINKELINNNIIDIVVNIDENYGDDDFQQYLLNVEKLNPAIPPNVRVQNNLNLNEIGDYKFQTTSELIYEYIKNLDNIEDNTKKLVYDKLIKLYEEHKNEF